MSLLMYNTFWAFLVSKKDHHSATLSLSRSRQGRAQLVREPKQEQIEQIELVSHLGPPRPLALLPFVPVIPAVHSFSFCQSVHFTSLTLYPHLTHFFQCSSHLSPFLS